MVDESDMKKNFKDFPKQCEEALEIVEGLRMDVCKDIFVNNVDVEEIEVLGESLLSKNFYLIYLGNWISYYLAINQGIDPSRIDIIENLKRSLRD